MIQLWHIWTCFNSNDVQIYVIHPWKLSPHSSKLQLVVLSCVLSTFHRHSLAAVSPVMRARNLKPASLPNPSSAACRKQRNPCMYVCMYVCLLACLLVCMFVRLYVCMSVYLYVCIFVCLYICMIVCLYDCMIVCLLVCMLVCMFVCMYVCMHVCMRVWRVSRAKSPKTWPKFNEHLWHQIIHWWDLQKSWNGHLYWPICTQPPREPLSGSQDPGNGSISSTRMACTIVHPPMEMISIDINII